MAVSHQALNRPKVVAIVKKGRSYRMSHHMGVNPLLDKCLFCRGLNETPHQNGVKPPLTGIVHEQVEGRAFVLPARDAVVNVFFEVQKTS